MNMQINWSIRYYNAFCSHTIFFMKVLYIIVNCLASIYQVALTLYFIRTCDCVYTCIISAIILCLTDYCVLFWLIEDDPPTMKDLNRYVTKKYATKWFDIGLELGLELHTLDAIEADHSQRCVTCFRKTLDMWLKLNGKPTWKSLEVALTNVERQQLDLDPVDDVYGEHM